MIAVHIRSHTMFTFVHALLFFMETIVQVNYEDRKLFVDLSPTGLSFITPTGLSFITPTGLSFITPTGLSTFPINMLFDVVV